MTYVKSGLEGVVVLDQLVESCSWQIFALRFHWTLINPLWIVFAFRRSLSSLELVATTLPSAPQQSTSIP